MDKKSYQNDQKSNVAHTMNTKEELEARLFDAMEQPLNSVESERLKKDLAAYPALLKSYEEMLGGQFLIEFKNDFAKEVFEQQKDSVIAARFEQNLIRKMDEEAFWLATFPQVKGIIYKFMMPVMAASLLLFFQFSEPANTTTHFVGNETQLFDSITGYEELDNIQASLQNYAGIAALDAVLAEFNEPTNAETNTNAKTSRTPNK